MNKRGYVFIPSVVIFSIFVMLTAYLVLTTKYDVKDSKGITRVLGGNQLKLFNSYQKGEDSRFYISQSAEYASVNSLYELAESKSGCGEYLGYSIWTNKTNGCLNSKNNMIAKLNSVVNEELGKFLAKYGSILPYFELSTEQNKNIVIYGKSRSPIVVNIDSQAQQSPSVLNSPTNLIWPANGPISSCYGYRHLKLETVERAQDWHDAVDIAVPAGTDIVSAGDGIVEKTCNEWQGICACSVGIKEGNPGSCKKEDNCYGKCGNYGNYVIIKHSDTFYTRYNHLSEVLVEKGSGVRRGQLIAKSGNTGLTGAAHLDLKVYLSNNFRSDIGKGNYDRNPLCYFPVLSQDKFVAESCNDADGTAIQFCKLKNNSATLQDQLEDTYSVAANFKVNLNYSFDEYYEINKSIGSIVEKITSQCYKSSEDTNSCANKILSQQKDFTWSYECGSNEEKAIRNLAETLTLCSQSPEEGFCSYEIPNIDSKVTIELKHTNALSTNIVSGSFNTTIPQDFPFVVEAFGSETIPRPVLQPCDKVTIEILKGKAVLKTENCPSRKNSNEIVYSGTIPLFDTISKSNKESLVSFVSPSSYESQKAKVKELSLVKKYLLLCAESKYKFLDAKGNKVPIVYKMAVFAQDSVAPVKVEDVSAKDTVNAEENITISWKANKEQDMKQYYVYYSEKEFSNVREEGVFSIGKVNQTKEDSYSRTFKIPSDGTHFFAVTPVDTSGNENTNVVSVSGNAIDDLNPGVVEKLEFNPPQGVAPIIEILVMPSNKNEDGSVLKDFTKYRVYASGTSSESCSASDISKALTKEIMPLSLDNSTSPHKVKVDLTSITSPDKKYCVIIVPEDEVSDIDAPKSGRYALNGVLFVRV